MVPRPLFARWVSGKPGRDVRSKSSSGHPRTWGLDSTGHKDERHQRSRIWVESYEGGTSTSSRLPSHSLKVVEGHWVDRVVGLDGVRAEIAMLQTPDGYGRLELTKFHTPSIEGGNRHTLENTRASAMSHSPSKTSTPSSPACEPQAGNSSPQAPCKIGPE